MLVIGLTGGIGSGKTTVSDLFSQYHIPIIDTDQIARDVIRPHQPAFAAIVEHFSPTLLQADGTINRATLRQMIFSNTTERLWLENLLHPLIRHTVKQQLAHLSAPYCLVVIPLLFETASYDFLDRILVVDSPLEKQIERVTHRDAVDASHVDAIIKTQVSRAERLAKAHDVIVNDRQIEHLRPQVEYLHHRYLKLAAEK